MAILNGISNALDWYSNVLPNLLVEFARNFPFPLNVICVVILGLFAYGWWLILLIVLYIVVYKVRKRKGFYTPTDCIACGKPTGFKGNKRFEVYGGYMCETCASKVLVASSVDLAKLPPDWFKLEPRAYTAQEVKGIVQRYDQVGKEQFLREIRAAEEARRKRGPVCPKCGCTSLSTVKAGEVGASVVITCLNCGYQWRPGQHRSW